MPTTLILTPAGKKKLMSELEELKKVQRPEIAKRIETAKEYGDLSENAEYLEAKENQAFIEGRITEIEAILKTAEVVDKHSTTDVNVGSLVSLKKNGEHVTYTIVGATEADPLRSKISIDSPVGQSLLGKKVNDVVEIMTPKGLVRYTVVKIL